MASADSPKREFELPTHENRSKRFPKNSAKVKTAPL
jgi:hypothetical protein